MELFRKAREPINSFTHSLGAALSVIGLVFMVARCYVTGASLATTITCIVFCIALILLYSASGIYHYATGSEGKIARLKKFDHAMIYVLIAGSYTPILYATMPAPRSIYFILLIWAIGLAGALFKIAWINMPRWLGSIIYIAMGWFVVLFPTALKNLSLVALILLISGGISYTIGGVIYWTKRPNFLGRLFGFHEVFHVFIMVGSLLHFLLVYFFIA